MHRNNRAYPIIFLCSFPLFAMDSSKERVPSVSLPIYGFCQEFDVEEPETVAERVVSLWSNGKGNPYVQNFLKKRFKGELDHDTGTRQQLAQEVDTARKETFEILESPDGELPKGTDLNRLLSELIIKELLEDREQQKERREQEEKRRKNADVWKYINGALAFASPVIAAGIEYLVLQISGACCSCDGGSTNSTMI